MSKIKLLKYICIFIVIILTNSKKIMSLPVNLQTKLEKLIAFLKDKRVIIAFSGGVDSSLLAYLSDKYAKQVLNNSIYD